MRSPISDASVEGVGSAKFGGMIESNFRMDGLALCMTTKNDGEYFIELAKGMPDLNAVPVDNDGKPISRYLSVTDRFALQSMNPQKFMKSDGSWVLKEYEIVEACGNAYPVHTIGEVFLQIAQIVNWQVPTVAAFLPPFIDLDVGSPSSDDGDEATSTHSSSLRRTSLSSGSVVVTPPPKKTRLSPRNGH